MTLSRDLFLAILSMDSYNRGYGQGVVLNRGDSTTNQNENGRRLGNAVIARDANDAEGAARNAGFYAIAYDVSGAGIDGLTGTVIAYRGSDYEDTNGDILRSNDLWQGWNYSDSALNSKTPLVMWDYSASLRNVGAIIPALFSTMHPRVFAILGRWRAGRTRHRGTAGY